MGKNVFILKSTDGQFFLAIPAFDDDVKGKILLSNIKGSLHLLRNNTDIDLNIPVSSYPEILKQKSVYITELDLSTQSLVRDYKGVIADTF